MASGGLNLGDVNIFSSYFRVEAGQHLTGIIIHAAPEENDNYYRSCGYARTPSLLTGCLQRAVKYADRAVQDIYQSALDAIKAPQLWEELKCSQELWSKYRDSQCKLRKEMSATTDSEMNTASNSQYAFQLRF
jgi:uncharacterized protein YecT (DUF1311 family)